MLGPAANTLTAEDADALVVRAAQVLRPGGLLIVAGTAANVADLAFDAGRAGFTDVRVEGGSELALPMLVATR
jgi:hypothetical protein